MRNFEREIILVQREDSLALAQIRILIHATDLDSGVRLLLLFWRVFFMNLMEHKSTGSKCCTTSDLEMSFV